MCRESGILLHISSLNGEFSSGSFGIQAREFIDILNESGFTWWQTLPFCPTDEYNSPYKSQGSFGGNPYFVDLETLFRKGLLTESELNSSRQSQPHSCEFERLARERISVLKLAASRVDYRDKIEKFVEKQPCVKEFCEFMALKTANGQKPWNEWTEREIDPETLFLWKFIQYEFFMQWAELKAYANSKNIKIMGDIPFYVSYDSADVWANKHLFMLDDDERPSFVSGVPPDDFNKDGQMWGNPLYDWNEMKKDGFSWWQKRMKHMLSLFDGVRIDHFRGIEAYWCIPANAENAKMGKWVKGPGEEFVKSLCAVQGDKTIVAEDLGEINDEVKALVRQSGFYGMKVFQFGFSGEDDNPYKPHNYEKKTIAYTGTHDNNTLLGYVWEMSEDDRSALFDYCGYSENDLNKCFDSIFRSIYASHSKIVIFPIQDILGFGSDTRMNTPGKANNNWGFRVTTEQLQNADWNKFAKWNRIYSRKNKGKG